MEDIKKTKPTMDAVKIRTMRKDMAKASAAPPPKLPIANEPERPALPIQRKREKTEVKVPPEEFLTSHLKITLIGIFAVFAIFATGGFFYWWNYLRTPPSLPPVYYQCSENQCLKIEGEGTDECLIDADCQITEPIIPQSLIQVDDTQIVELFVGEEGGLLSRLQKLSPVPSGLQERVLIKYIGRTERRYLDLASLLNYLDIEIPADISQAIAPAGTNADNYTLFLYGQEGENYSCLLLKLDGTDISEALESWEAATIVPDLENLLMQSLPADWAENEFHDNVYKDVSIRYINFPSAEHLSIDYAVIDDLLLIATSKESMYTAIDALK